MFADDQRTLVAEAIAAAEAGTSGEIVCIVSERAERYAATGLTIAAVLAFALPLLAVVLGVEPARLLPLRSWDSGDVATEVRRAIEAYAAFQILIFAASAALLVWTGLGAKLTPRSIRRDKVHGDALAQFRARGLVGTRQRTGVLIYVSMADRIAEVIADAGIYAKVDPEHWGTTIDALLRGLKAGTPAQGFVDAVALAGAVLAKHFPPTVDDNPNELPDRLIVL